MKEVRVFDLTMAEVLKILGEHVHAKNKLKPGNYSIEVTFDKARDRARVEMSLND